MEKIKIYELNKEYVKYFSQYQSHLFYDEGMRKYIGIGQKTRITDICYRQRAAKLTASGTELRKMQKSYIAIR